MPYGEETPYSPGALRAWARYMSRIGRDDLAAQLNAQADAAEQMQPVGSAFDTWLGGYGSRLGWNPQAAAPAAARPQVSGNYLGNLGTWRPAQEAALGMPGYGSGRGTMNPVQGARNTYFAGLQNQPVTPASYYGWNQLSNYVPSTGTTIMPGGVPPAPSDNNYYRDALLRMANAYNRWGDYIGGGIDYRLSPLNVANINAIPAGGDYSKAFNQLNRWGQPLGTAGSPAPA